MDNVIGCIRFYPFNDLKMNNLESPNNQETKSG